MYDMRRKCRRYSSCLRNYNGRGERYSSGGGCRDRLRGLHYVSRFDNHSRRTRGGLGKLHRCGDGIGGHDRARRSHYDSRGCWETEHVKYCP